MKCTANANPIILNNLLIGLYLLSFIRIQYFIYHFGYVQFRTNSHFEIVFSRLSLLTLMLTQNS